MNATTRCLPLAGLLATGLFISAADNMRAQTAAQITAKQFSACYVPATGTVYLIKQPGLRSECAPGHVQFSWSDGGSSPAVTPAVVITDPDGWAATGTFGSGVIPVTGAGVRLMWYPRKGAFRAGGVSGTQWDDASVGNYSIAMGTGTMATASRSTALGQNTTASGSTSTALGFGTSASGLVSTALGNSTVSSGNFATAMGDHAAATSDAATAMGEGATASGDASTAMGGHTTASGDFSTAMGDRAAATAVGSTAMGILTTASGSGSTAMGALASTNLRQGSFVYGDFSTSASGALVQATADNSFVVRASGGFRFRTSPDLSTGCDVSGGTLAGNLTCSGTIYSTSGGFRFPDNTVQTTAATGGGAASDVVCTGCVGTSDLANGAVTAVKLAAGVARNTHWAGVTSTGTVFKQTGGISGSLTATGTYDLTFPSGLNLNSGCTNLASGIDGTNILQTIDGPRFGAPSNLLRVRVFDVAGNLVNAGFEVAVICL